MGFPFLAPLKEWTTKKLEEREKNKEALNTLMPFIILSSAAVVTDTPRNNIDLKSVYAGGGFDAFAYKGCVIANSTDILKNYQTGKTIIGYDLDGKPIEVKGEENRRVSMPIIESLEINTDGGNNTLKTAQINIKVFTLKQLEMFELFFLRPSMRLVLEYGWNVGVREKLDIQTHMFANKSHDKYIEKYSKIFSRKQDGYRIAKGEYISTLEDTGGNYDFMAGQVSNFNYSPQSDGTFNVMLEISAGNELQLWMPIKQSTDSGKSTVKDTSERPTPYQTWVGKLAADLNNPKFVKILGNQTDWEDEFFNWSAINSTQKDTTFSKDAYISFRLILHLLNNIREWNEKEKSIAAEYYKDQAGKEPIIPITSNHLIISSTKDFILPGKLPKISVTQKGDVITISETETEECFIKGRQFNLSNQKSPEQINIYENIGTDDKGNPITKVISVPAETGNLLNLYFRYEAFVTIYNGGYTSADVINGLFDTINSHMYGLCKLELTKQDDSPIESPLIIIDRKISSSQPKSPKDKIWRFKVGALNSIVKEFSFNMELSTLMQAQALYSSQLAIAAATKDAKTGVVPEKDPYSHADLSYARNADNYYSVNAIEIEIVKQSNEWNKTIKETANVIPEPPKAEAQEEVKNLSEVREKNYIKFKQNPDSKTEPVKNFIYTDPALIQSKIKTSKQKPTTTALTYLDISLAIDGIAGISCGEYFLIDGVPEIYNQHGYFQVTNVKHGIDTSGWKTTIEAGYRIKAIDPEEETK